MACEMPSAGRSVIVAMSGGVDSSVAAALLRDGGWDVTGAFLRLGGRRSPGDAAAARRVADALGIALHVLDFTDDFEPIIDEFAAEYARGRTPNPCIHCNRLIKFGRLIDHADSLGIEHVATGHHARRIDGGAGPLLARGRTRGKDQSYALFAIPRARLRRILLPIGEVLDKRRVRNVARSLGLDVHDRPDSQEICFVDDGYVSLLRQRAPEALRSGEIVNAAGEVLGRHAGYGRYTIGQRRGLGVAVGEAMYVTHIDPATARVTIGPRAEAASRRLSAAGANWHADVPEAFEATVRVRYNHRGAAGRVTVTGAETFEVEFRRPVHAITPGQAAVVYDGGVLLGGGWIE